MHLSLSDSIMMMPTRYFWRTFPNEAFIQNAKSFWVILLTLTFPLSFTVRNESLFVTSPSFVLSCYFNMHGIDRFVPHFVTRVLGISIPITPQLVADVLRVPRIDFFDYPSCERLRIVSKDELMSSFCERPLAWGECQFTYCSGFAKGPQFLNMVMTFVLYPLSHYNSITESRARFLLSLLERLTIDFPSHFILSLIDVF